MSQVEKAVQRLASDFIQYRGFLPGFTTSSILPFWATSFVLTFFVTAMNFARLSGLFVLLIFARRGRCAPLTKRELPAQASTSKAPAGLTIPGRGVEDIDDAAKYLNKYGYLDVNDTSSGVDKVKRALILFQKLFKKNVTGELDDETLVLMNTPRCSLPDIVIGSNGSPGRYELFQSWGKKLLTYSFVNYPSKSYGFYDRQEIVNAIDDGFLIWTNYADLEIVKDQSNPWTDLTMSFRRGNHGDMDPFDGPGNVLAHAFFPEDGRIHMDDDETWSNYGNDSLQEYNLRLVLAHEVGHALGLKHSYDSSALMYAYYHYGPFQLEYDDILGIQALYGARAETSASRRTSTTTRATQTARTIGLTSSIPVVTNRSPFAGPTDTTTKTTDQFIPSETTAIGPDVYLILLLLNLICIAGSV